MTNAKKNENQFNKKVKLNEKIRSLKAQIEGEEIMDNIIEPKLLIVEEILFDLDGNSKEIEKYTKNINEDNFKCNFIYAYSLFEGALWQLAKSVLYAFHEKLEPVKVQFGEDGKASFDGNEMLESFIEEKLKMISTGNLTDHFKEIMKIVEVKVNFGIDTLNDISKARNSIVHTNTTKSKNEENRAKVPKHPKKTVIEKHMVNLKKLLDEVYNAISKKYKDYTLIRLLEEAWNYTVGGYMDFNTLMGFDKSFESRIVIRPNFDLIKKALESFSSTEKAYLAIWLQQYGSDNLYDLFKISKPFKAWAWLDRKKLMFLTTLFDRFPYLMNGHDFTNELKKEKSNG